jgi:DNA-binding transcriptional MerR regulator
MKSNQNGGDLMRIGELSQRTGVSVRSLRYYDQKNLLTVRRLDNGYRDFTATCIERVQTIQLYLGLGLTAEQIGRILHCKENISILALVPACEEILLSLYLEKLQEIEDQIALLRDTKGRLKERIALLQQADAGAMLAAIRN